MIFHIAKILALGGKIDRKLLTTCNYHAVDAIPQEQLAVIESKHRNKGKLPFPRQ